MGVSAGSYIACPTIEIAGWKHADWNTVGLKDLTAMGLIPFLIKAHFVTEEKDFVSQQAKKTEFPLVALADTQAILVEDNKIKLVGEGGEYFWNGFEEK